jgi:hypothetical protein
VPAATHCWRRRGTARPGAFVVLDPPANATARLASADLLQFEAGRLTPAERYSRSGHLPATVWLTARTELAWLLERRLFDRGCLVQAVADDMETNLLPELARILNAAGLIVICSVSSGRAEEDARAQSVIGDARFLHFAPDEIPADDDEAARVVIRRLEDRGVLRKEDFTAGEGI